MKPIYYFVVVLSILALVNYSGAQGSPAASIAAYITRFRLRKRQSALKASQHSGAQIVRRRAVVDCDGFYSYIEPCRKFHT